MTTNLSDSVPHPTLLDPILHLSPSTGPTQPSIDHLLEKPDRFQLAVPDDYYQLRDKEPPSSIYELPASPVDDFLELVEEEKLAGFNLVDLYEMLQWCHQKWPEAQNLGAEDQKKLLIIMQDVIEEHYPRYDQHTLFELTTILEDYIRPQIEEYLDIFPEAIRRQESGKQQAQLDPFLDSVSSWQAMDQLDQ